MLVLTMLIMGIATIGIGLVPTYAQIGIAAPLILPTPLLGNDRPSPRFILVALRTNRIRRHSLTYLATSASSPNWQRFRARNRGSFVSRAFGFR